MPVRPAFWNYDHVRDGQIAAGTVTSPWFDVQGFSTVNVKGNFTTGTTQVFVDYSSDGVTVAASSADQFANLGGNGANVPVPQKYARLRIVQTVATTTVAQLGGNAAGNAPVAMNQN